MQETDPKQVLEAWNAVHGNNANYERESQKQFGEFEDTSLFYALKARMFKNSLFYNSEGRVSFDVTQTLPYKITTVTFTFPEQVLEYKITNQKQLTEVTEGVDTFIDKVLEERRLSAIRIIEEAGFTLEDAPK